MTLGSLSTSSINSFFYLVYKALIKLSDIQVKDVNHSNSADWRPDTCKAQWPMGFLILFLLFPFLFTDGSTWKLKFWQQNRVFFWLILLNKRVRKKIPTLLYCPSTTKYTLSVGFFLIYSDSTNLPVIFLVFLNEFQ